MNKCALQTVPTDPRKPSLSQPTMGPEIAAPTIIREFTESLDCRDATKTLYLKALKRFLLWLNEQSEMNITNVMHATTEMYITKSTIVKFKAHLRSESLSVNTINSYLVGLKRFFAYLEEAGVHPNVTKDIKGARQSGGHLRDPFSKQEVKEILSQIDTATLRGKRDYAIINLMARTGLRTIEVSRANLEDLRARGDEGILHIQGKGKDTKDEFVLLTKESLEPLSDYLSSRGGVPVSSPIFASLSNRNKNSRLTTRSLRGIIAYYHGKTDTSSSRLSAHSLRHFFATCSLQSGAPVLQVKDALRHKSIDTTQRYLHNLDRIENGAERYIEF